MSNSSKIWRPLKEPAEPDWRVVTTGLERKEQPARPPKQRERANATEGRPARPHAITLDEQHTVD